MNYNGKAALGMLGILALTSTAYALDFQPHPEPQAPAWTQAPPSGPPASSNGGGLWVRPIPGDAGGGGAGVVGGYEGREGNIRGGYQQPQIGTGSGFIGGGHSF